jgi:hypothetical protein
MKVIDLRESLDPNVYQAFEVQLCYSTLIAAFFMLVHCLVCYSALKMEATCSSETLIAFRWTAEDTTNRICIFQTYEYVHTYIYIYKNVTVRLCVVFGDEKLRK